MKKRFSGILAKPIRLTEKYQEVNSLLDKELTQRYLALFQHYQIPMGVSLEENWIANYKLVMALAGDFVPGLKVKRTNKGGRPGKWKGAEGIELIGAILMIKKTKNFNILRACRHLCGKGENYEGKDPEQLYARYYEALKNYPFIKTYLDEQE